MSPMPKRLSPRGPGLRDINRYARLSDSRNSTVRKVAVKPPEAPAPAPVVAPPTPPVTASKPKVVFAPPKTPFDGERQTLVCLYLHLFTSEHPEGDLAKEFWNCYRHLLEGGGLADMPLRLVNRHSFLEEVENLKAGKGLLLDYPPDPTAAPVVTGEKNKNEQRRRPRGV